MIKFYSLYGRYRQFLALELSRTREQLPLTDKFLSFYCGDVQSMTDIPYYTDSNQTTTAIDLLEKLPGTKRILIGTGSDYTADALAKYALNYPSDILVAAEPMDLDIQSISGLTPEEALSALAMDIQTALVLRASLGRVPCPYDTNGVVLDLTAHRLHKPPIFDSATIVFPDPINAINMALNTFPLIKNRGEIEIIALATEITDDIMPSLPSRFAPYNVEIDVVEPAIIHDPRRHPDTKLKDSFFSPEAFRIGRILINKY